MTAREKPAEERLEPPAGAPLDNAERRLRDFAEAASDWFWELDRELRIIYMSDGVNAPSSDSARDFLGKRITEVRGRGLEQVDWAPLLELQLARQPFRDFRLCRATRGGAIRHVSLSGIPVFDAEGAFQGYRGVSRDITKQVNAETRVGMAERELREKTRLLEATLENMEQGLIVLDAGLHIRAWNDRCVALLDLPKGAMGVGRPVEHLFRVIGERDEYGPGDLNAIVATLMDRLVRCDPPIWVRQRRRICSAPATRPSSRAAARPSSSRT
ncbi:MAG TPA: PAS-domain containing protein [Stellaceae bacterium]|nr:PAS-domain containing protein [Stellaceae bacterium]